MTAGTVVITGGILAAVILLCIIAVLCYCRLQYYCCKKNGSDPDAVCPQPQFACHTCSTSRLDGAASSPLSLSPELTPPQSFCPTCSPFYISTAGETLNGAERIAYMPSLTLPSLHSRPDLYSNTRAISTDV
ncbi:protein FAM163A [Puntigrus tetrazona]|uniref:protein FAM163A n=1 Tax=Puntigrus tetrazona TaxID=1606681 RepID=UPI001C8A86DE|nr:protein FAM163A [Puntigrus tetrazona]